MSKPRRDEEDNPLTDLRERIVRLETDFKWMRESLRRIESRTWYILGSVVAFGVISILLSLLS